MGYVFGLARRKSRTDEIAITSSVYLIVTLAKIVAVARTHGLGFGLDATVNFILPYFIYDYAAPRLGDVDALIASSAPPIAWSVIEFARRRRIDALSMIVLAGIALSLLAVFGGGSARFLQLRENLVTGLIGIVFLGSAAISRPLIYHLARATIMRRSSSEAESFEAQRDDRNFRRMMTVMTVVWGFGLIAQAAVASVMVFSMSISTYLLLSPFVSYGMMGALGLWTLWYSRRHSEDAEESELKTPVSSEV